MLRKNFVMNYGFWGLAVSLILLTLLPYASFAEEQQKPNYKALIEKRTKENAELLKACPYTIMGKDFFSRFSLDPNAKPADSEFAIDKNWKIMLSKDASLIAETMSGHFVDFMKQNMKVELATEKSQQKDLSKKTDKVILFTDSGGGDANTPESFTIEIKPGLVTVAGRDSAGLRDGIVKLVDMIGFRQAPILKASQQQVYKPRIALRLGSHGSNRDTVFMGYNAVVVSAGDLYQMSTSNAIPELVPLRDPNKVKSLAKQLKDARKYGLKTYLYVDTRMKRFAKDDPIFIAHPEIRGSMTWVENGLYNLCTEQPLVKQFLTESVEGVFRNNPDLDGLVIIIGGEGFYHCFMRPYGTMKGHTNCPRCEALGAETVVSNMCNYLGEAGRIAKQNTAILAWPYSAKYCWSADDAQIEFINKLKPGTALLSEIDKDEVMHKSDGVNKTIWDYGIDLVGPSERAKKQIAACKSAGIPVYMMSMIEETLEYTRQPDIPCMDRWAERAEALATCGLDGVYVWQMGPYYGTSAGEINKFLWWTPVPDKEQTLQRLAVRMAGKEAGPDVRKAWKFSSEAMGYSPEVGSYYKGPHHLGPLHPMCADPNAKLPEVFYGAFGFLAEIKPEVGIMFLPVFYKSVDDMKPDRPENCQAFEGYYRKMEALLKQACDEMNKAKPLVPQYCSLMFNAENSSVQWFYHTARSQANFFESCRLRDRMKMITAQLVFTPLDVTEATNIYSQWRKVLLDEKANAAEALPIIEADARLDWAGETAHGVDMLKAKLEIIDHEINDYLPLLAKRCNIKQN